MPTLQETLNALRDFAQGASNSVASNVSAPVDALAWLLRKGGVPMGDAPVGGSAWMAQHGLTAQPRNRLAELAGETAGMIGPMAAVAKAPQIANGLLRMGENALANPAVRGPLAGQDGVIAFHGSPHKFDRFDMSKIGTGEGAQAYGHGLYFADSPGVANTYKDALANDALIAGGKVVTPAAGSVADVALAHLASAPPDANPYQWAARSARVARDEASAANKPFFDKVFHALGVMESKGIKAGNSGQFYKVEIPDEAVERMVQWDKPLRDQSPVVREAINRVGRDAGPYGLDRVADDMRMIEMSRLFQSPEGVKRLSGLGVPGIRYLDGGSRGAGNGTFNTVLFDDSLAKILERNGQPVTGNALSRK